MSVYVLPPISPHRDPFALPPLEGVPPSRFWQIARLANCPISTVMAIAGGHTWRKYPVKKVRHAARRVALLDNGQWRLVV